MSSTVLSNGSESGWVKPTGGFMGKSPNLDPNPTKKPRRSHHKSNVGSLDDLNDFPAIMRTASDDAHSFVQKPIEANRCSKFNHGDFVTYHLDGYSKIELSDFRKRLLSELDQIRYWRDRIEIANFSGKTCGPTAQGNLKKFADNKKSTYIASNKNVSSRFDDFVMYKELMKECRHILAKLMKHKCAWIFNKPVDTVGLGLHDYHHIIKHPMDLGTVRSNLSKKIYSSPGDFAEDVRLTFDNALLYNPKTDEVHQWAEMLLSRFENLFSPIQAKLPMDRREYRNEGVVEDLRESSWNQILTPSEKVKKSKPSSMGRDKERMQSQSSASTMSNPLPPVIPSRAQSPVPTNSSKTAPKPRALKQPKPKAKDPNKREMSMEEKNKLGFDLQSLPQEKLGQLVHIIKKRNEHLSEDGDEIELDIEALDTETLWELDRFVTNWKKMVSKTKRLASMINNDVLVGDTEHQMGDTSIEHHVADTSTAEVDDRGTSNDKDNDCMKTLEKGEFEDEDIDIDDDVPASNFPAVEIEKDEMLNHDDGIADEAIGKDPGNANGVDGQYDRNVSSSSSSSSSDSSSSSGTDSGSSSGSDDSDADDVQS